MGLLRYIREVYENEEGPTVATGILAVGISLLFTVGLFLILNAHSSSQSQQLEQMVAAIRKSQDEGISVNEALSQLKTASLLNNKKNTKTDPNAPVVGSFDILTVKGTSVFQANVTADKDVAVGGKLKAKDVVVSGDIVKDGTNLDYLYIQNQSDDPQSSTTASIDDLTVGQLTVDGDASVAGDLTASSLSVDADGSFGGDVSGNAITAGGDLTVSGVSDVQDLAVHGDATIDGTLQVTGDTTLGNLNVTGNLQINGTDIDELFIQNAGSAGTPAIDISGDITGNNLTANGTLSVGGNLSLTAGNLILGGSGHLKGNADIRGTITITDGSSTSNPYSFATPYDNPPVVIVTPIDQAVPFSVDADESGFVINLDSVAVGDIRFYYLVME